MICIRPSLHTKIIKTRKKVYCNKVLFMLYKVLKEFLCFFVFIKDKSCFLGIFQKGVTVSAISPKKGYS